MEGPAPAVRQPVRDGRVLVGGVVVQDGVDIPSGGRLLLDPVEDAMNSWCRWRSEWLPMTIPSRMFSAANSVVIPFRLSSCVTCQC